MKALCSDVGVAGTPYFGMVTLGVHMHKKNHESVAGLVFYDFRVHANTQLGINRFLSHQILRISNFFHKLLGYS